MTKQRRSFSTEFKHDAAVLVLDKGYTLSAASRAVGIGEPTGTSTATSNTRPCVTRTSVPCVCLRWKCRAR